MFATILGILAVSLWLLCVIRRAINIPPQRIFSSTLNNTRASSRDRSSPRAGSASSPSSTGGPSHAALYHKLHNLEDFSEILPRAYQFRSYSRYSTGSISRAPTKHHTEHPGTGEVQPYRSRSLLTRGATGDIPPMGRLQQTTSLRTVTGAV